MHARSIVPRPQPMVSSTHTPLLRGHRTRTSIVNATTSGRTTSTTVLPVPTHHHKECRVLPLVWRVGGQKMLNPRKTYIHCLSNNASIFDRNPPPQTFFLEVPVQTHHSDSFVGKFTTLPHLPQAFLQFPISAEVSTVENDCRTRFCVLASCEHEDDGPGCGGTILRDVVAQLLLASWKHHPQFLDSMRLLSLSNS